METPAWILVGVIVAPFGLTGEVKVEVASTNPARFAPRSIVYLGDGERRLIVSSARPHKGRLLVKFHGVDTMNDAEALRNGRLSIRAAQLAPLPEGEYYHFQLIGLTVSTVEGDVLGSLTEVLETGANDVYVVRNSSGREYLIPALRSVLREVSIEESRMVVEPLPGLFEI